MKFKAAAFTIHSYLGLIAGVFILLFSLTGGLLLFSKEINKALYAPLLKAEASGEAAERGLSFDEAYRQALKAYPGYVPYRIFQGIHNAEESLEVGLQRDDFREHFSVYFNPVSGKMLGKLQNPLTASLLELHYTFLMGKTGEVLAALFALSFLGSIITGFVVYRKHLLRVLLFREPLRLRNWRMASSSLHRILGVWALVFNLMLAFTGFWLVRSALDLKEHFSDSSEAAAAPADPLQISIDSAFRQAQQAIPGLVIHYISLPRSQGDPLVMAGDTPGGWIYGEFNNTVAFDAESGEIISVVEEAELSGEEKFSNLVYTLHFGQYGGIFIKLVYLFFSLATAAISITGFLLYWKRKRRKPVPEERQLRKSVQLGKPKSTVAKDPLLH